MWLHTAGGRTGLRQLQGPLPRTSEEWSAIIPVVLNPAEPGFQDLPESPGPPPGQPPDPESRGKGNGFNAVQICRVYHGPVGAAGEAEKEVMWSLLPRQASRLVRGGKTGLCMLSYNTGQLGCRPSALVETLGSSGTLSSLRRAPYLIQHGTQLMAGRGGL